MRVSDRLIMAAHYPEGHYRLAVLHQHSRDDRVERPLARRDCVRMTHDRTEPGAAVVQQHAALWRQNPGPERREKRIDERARIAVSIDGAKVDGVLVFDLGPVRSGHRVVEPDRPAGTLG